MDRFQPSLEDSIEFATHMDRHDPLRPFRDRFHVAEGTSYLCGNCLGLPPKAAATYLQEVLDGWGQMGFRAHFNPPHHWKSYDQQHLVRTMGEVVGARASEVALMNSLTVNLHLMLSTFYRPSGQRRKILIEDGAFPSDQLALMSHLSLHGLEGGDGLLRVPRDPDTGLISAGALTAMLDEHGPEIALVFLGNTSFRNGQVLPMGEITEAARRQGCVVGFDLAHAVGNVELHLHDWGVDFGVWCNYKYMNGGPGCVGGCFVHERHGAEPLPRLAGWWGQHADNRFNLASPVLFNPAPGAQGWQVSSPSILAMAPLRASLELFAEAGMGNLRRKSVQMSHYFQHFLDTSLATHCQSLTPRAPQERGCQFTVRVRTQAAQLQQWLLSRGIVCDVQGEDIVRIAFAPLYNAFTDVHRIAAGLHEYFALQSESSCPAGAIAA